MKFHEKNELVTQSWIHMFEYEFFSCTFDFRSVSPALSTVDHWKQFGLSFDGNVATHLHSFQGQERCLNTHRRGRNLHRQINPLFSNINEMVLYCSWTKYIFKTHTFAKIIQIRGLAIIQRFKLIEDVWNELRNFCPSNTLDKHFD